MLFQCGNTHTIKSFFSTKKVKRKIQNSIFHFSPFTFPNVKCLLTFIVRKPSHDEIKHTFVKSMASPDESKLPLDESKHSHNKSKPPLDESKLTFDESKSPFDESKLTFVKSNYAFALIKP